MTDEFRVHVTNPRKKRKGKPVAKRKTRRKTITRRRASPRRRKRRANPGTSRRAAPRRRRRNPASGGGGGITLRGALSGEFARQMGKMWVAFAVRRFGGDGSLFGGARTSVFAGTSWTLRNYAIGFAAAYIGAKLLARMGWGRPYAKDFWIGAFTAMASKVLWTEGFSRSPLLQQAFGQYPNNVLQDPGGTTWIQRDGAWQSMMGAQMVDASALDGQLVDSSALDGGDFGGLVDAGAMDGRFRGLGHALPHDTPTQESRAAVYRGDGSPHPYQSSYQGTVGAFSGAYSGA